MDPAYPSVSVACVCCDQPDQFSEDIVQFGDNSCEFPHGNFCVSAESATPHQSAGDLLHLFYWPFNTGDQASLVSQLSRMLAGNAGTERLELAGEPRTGWFIGLSIGKQAAQLDLKFIGIGNLTHWSGTFLEWRPDLNAVPSKGALDKWLLDGLPIQDVIACASSLAA